MHRQGGFPIIGRISLGLGLLAFSCAALGLSACESEDSPPYTLPAPDAARDGSSADASATDGASSDGAPADAAEGDAPAGDDVAASDAPADAPEGDVPASDAPPVAAIQHRLLMVDNSPASRLIYLDQKEPAKGWSVMIPAGSRDLQIVGANVLVSHGNGAAEYSLANGAKGWTVASFTGVSTAQRLPNGNTLIGSSTPKSATDPGTIVFHEVNSGGVEVATVTVTGIEQLRLARRLANGNTLFTGQEPVTDAAAVYNVYEANPAGAVVWTKQLPGKGYVATRLANGNTLATTGATVTLVELDAAGTKVKELGGAAAHPMARLQWFSGFQVLPNGNTVIANWLGDGMLGKGPHAVEFDPTNKLVWQWEDHAAAMTVTNLLVVE